MTRNAYEVLNGGLVAGTIVFDDRRAAGTMLGSELKFRQVRADAVLGLIRGGMPVAFEVAQALGAPLDILAVKKLRAPMQEELGIGAVCADGTQILRRELIKELGVENEYLQREVMLRLAEALEAERLYRGDLPPLDIAQKEVILVDDGIATGATMEAAIRSARQRGASRIAVAIPVGSQQACADLKPLVDLLFCLTIPVHFWAVGQFYRKFPQVEDAEVQQLLAESRQGEAAVKAR